MCQPDDQAGCPVLLVWNTSTDSFVCNLIGPACALIVFTLLPSASVVVVAVPNGPVPYATLTVARTARVAAARPPSSIRRRLDSDPIFIRSSSPKKLKKLGTSAVGLARAYRAAAHAGLKLCQMRLTPKGHFKTPRAASGDASAALDSSRRLWQIFGEHREEH